MRRLTVKLRGRAEAPDQSRGCTLSSRTRGDTTDSHGPLQRLLDGASVLWRLTQICPVVPAAMIIAANMESVQRSACGRSEVLIHLAACMVKKNVNRTRADSQNGRNRPLLGPNSAAAPTTNAADTAANPSATSRPNDLDAPSISRSTKARARRAPTPKPTKTPGANAARSR